ncbi:MAG TPA: OsmC family protein [Terriglobales bacterium]|nr:OsmC family protein [Terriglobales bacterium]
MEKEHIHRVVAWWTSGRTGLAKSESAPNAIHFTAPPQFGGIEGRWTPEDLLITALASCFTTTFHTVAEYSKFEYTDLAVEAEGAVVKAAQGYCFSEIVIRPSLTIPSEENRGRAVGLLHQAKKLCLVSRALAKAQKFEARIEISKRLRSDWGTTKSRTPVLIPNCDLRHKAP